MAKWIQMTIILPALAITFAAACVWLTIRVYNRRERWAKWTLAGVVLALAYPLSCGPMLWLGVHGWTPAWLVEWLYWPLDMVMQNAPKPISEPLVKYVLLWGRLATGRPPL